MRHRIAAAVSCSLLLLSSCQQRNEHKGPAAVVADARSAIVVMPDLPLWKPAGGGLAQTTVTLGVGERVAITGAAQAYTQAEKQRDYLPVRLESGAEGWVRSDYAIPRAILAVVITDDVMVYSAEANTAATTESIPRMTIVVIHSETGGMPFIRVSWYDPSAKAMRRRVILRNEGVSANPSDVQAAILLHLAAASTNVKQQKAFLSSAVKDYPDSVFLPDLQAALDALTSPRPPSAAVPQEPAPGPPPPGGTATDPTAAPGSAPGYSKPPGPVPTAASGSATGAAARPASGSAPAAPSSP